MHDKDECRNHVALSYIASLVTENETRLIHVDTLRKSVGLNINLENFDNADDVIYGSAIGKNATVVNAKQHSMHEFVRSGTNLEFIRPSKSQKLQSSRDQSEVATSSLSFLKPRSIDICNDLVNNKEGDEGVRDFTFHEESSYKSHDSDGGLDLVVEKDVPRISDYNVNKRVTRSDVRKQKASIQTFEVSETSRTRSRASVRTFRGTDRSTSPAISYTNNSSHASGHPVRSTVTNDIETISRVVGTNRCVISNSGNQISATTTEDEDIITFFNTHVEEDNAGDGNRLDEEGDDLDYLSDDGWVEDNGNDPIEEVNEERVDDMNIDQEMDENEGPEDRELRAALGSLTMHEEIYGMSEKLPPYANNSLPIRTPEEMAQVDTSIKGMIESIKEHRKCLSLSSSVHMKYLEILIEMNRSNAPQSLFDSVAQLIHHNFDSKGDNTTAPTRQKMITWIERQVHPQSLKNLSKPKSKFLHLPSGRSVTITYFDYRYQLALLLSNEEIMDAANLLFPNLDDIFELPAEDCPLNDVNSGYFHQKMTRALCKFKGDLLFPFIDFCDGTNVSRNSIEPYLRSFGILKREIRNKPEAWFPLGFFEPIVNYSALAPGIKYDSAAKLSDYHCILSFLFEPVAELERTGFLHELDLGDRGKQTVVFKPCTQLTLGDCKGGNIFCAKYGTFKGTKMLCRDCDVPSNRSARPNWKCTFINKFRMKYKSAAELKQMSFWKINQNAFDTINRQLPDVWGVYGITPPEILHLLYIGLAVYLVSGFIFQRSGVMKKYLDESSISLYIHNKRQSLRGMPNLVAYRNGFTSDVAMTTGKEKFAKVFLLCLFFMKKDICE